MTESEPRTCPSAADVALRMLCLDMLQHRREAEDAYLRAKTDDALAELEGNVEAMVAFLRESELWESLSEEESDAFDTPLGEWKEAQYVDATWRVESLAVMAWALGLLKRLPSFDTAVTGEELQDVLDIDRWERVVEEATLRGEEDIRRARDIAALWDWRAQVGTPPYENSEDETEITEEVRLAEEKGHVTLLMQGDLIAHGKAYRDVTEDELDELGSIALERHYSLNWLCGYGEDWDDVPTDD